MSAESCEPRRLGIGRSQGREHEPRGGLHQQRMRGSKPTRSIAPSRRVVGVRLLEQALSGPGTHRLRTGRCTRGSVPPRTTATTPKQESARQRCPGTSHTAVGSRTTRSPQSTTWPERVSWVRSTTTGTNHRGTVISTEKEEGVEPSNLPVQGRRNAKRPVTSPTLT